MLTDLLRCNPADELRSIFDQFERRLSDWSRSSRQRTLPEMASTDERMSLRIPLPGMSREDVEITSTGRTLRVRAFRSDEGRSVTEYEQVLTLPDHVDIDRSSASMRRGLLEISLPYRESLKPKRIEIETDAPKQLSSAA